MAIKRSWHPSPNYSSRGGSSVRMITVHTTEGATTNQSLANFICQASAQVSYHISVDNVSDNICFEYVSRGNKAWAQANYNPVAVTGVFCTPTGASANWKRDYWLNNQRQALENMAQWVAEEAKQYGIPLTELSASQAQGGGRGVCQHSDLGSGGSGHYDCGNGFPMDELLRLAKGGQAPSSGPNWATLYGSREDDFMGTVKNGLPLGRPRDVEAIRLFGSVPAGGYISITVRQYTTGKADPYESAVKLTPENHRADVTLRDNTDGYTFAISGNSPEVGYCFI